MKSIIFLFLIITSSFAQILGDPVALTQRAFNAVSVEQENIILTDAQSDQLAKTSGQKLDTKIYRMYVAKKGVAGLGYGVLLSKKVRTKTAVVLYLIGMDHLIKSIEIVAFNEPMEYLPSKTWLDVFDNKSAANTLRLNQDIPTTTGATLSARAITDGSRLALALINVVKL